MPRHRGGASLLMSKIMANFAYKLNSLQKMTIEDLIEDLAANNPCVKFIVDNYEMLCIAHPGKVVMAMNANKPIMELIKGPEAYVAKVFDSMIEAMSYTRALVMGHVPYALVECDGTDIAKSLMWSIGCRE